MKYAVKAEFVDVCTGTRYVPAILGAEPTLFEPHDDDQRDRLVAARCLHPEPTNDLPTKPIDELTRAELEQITIAAFVAEIMKSDDDRLRDAVHRLRELAVEAEPSSGLEPQQEPASEQQPATDAESAATEEQSHQSPAPETPAAANPLDHDRDGKAGGSQKGEQSTAAKGRARKQVED